jgi:hypothetical protein
MQQQLMSSHQKPLPGLLNTPAACAWVLGSLAPEDSSAAAATALMDDVKLTTMQLLTFNNKPCVGSASRQPDHSA